MDRLTRGSDMALAQVISIDKENKNVLVRTVQRGAKVNAKYKIVEPARLTRLVRDPSSLVYVYRPNETVDFLEYFSSSISASESELWNHVEQETSGEEQ